MTKDDGGFVKKHDFKDIRFPVKIWDIHKIKKENFIDISVFGYENEGKHPIYVWKKCWSIIDKRRRQKTLCSFKAFNTFMYDHTLHCGKT